MEAKNSILNALLQQAILSNQAVTMPSTVPVNLSVSSNDERSEVTSSPSMDEESPADLSSRGHRDMETPPPVQSHGTSQPDPAQLMQAMAAAFSFPRELITTPIQDSLSPVGMCSPSSPDASHLVAKALVSATMRRPRSEKKPIPEDLKDSKYYERRRRNNLAAKRSRDLRKSREDQVTMRANFLEKENSVLRAQVATLRDEAFALKQMLLHKQASVLLRSQTATS